MAIKLTLRNATVRGTYTRELQYSNCGICKQSINEAAPLPEAVNGEEVDHFTLEASGHTLQKGACGHIFHACCIHQWLARSHTCPLCNAGWKSQSVYM